MQVSISEFPSAGPAITMPRPLITAIDTTTDTGIITTTGTAAISTTDITGHLEACGGYASIPGIPTPRFAPAGMSRLIRISSYLKKCRFRPPGGYLLQQETREVGDWMPSWS